MKRRAFLKTMAAGLVSFYSMGSLDYTEAAAIAINDGGSSSIKGLEYEFVTYDEIAPLRLSPIEGDGVLSGGEEALRFHTKTVTRAEFERIFPGKQAARHIRR